MSSITNLNTEGKSISIFSLALALFSAQMDHEHPSLLNGLDPGHNLLKLSLHIMLRKPAQIRPVGNPSPKQLISLPLAINSLPLRHPPPLLREGVDTSKKPVHKRPPGLVVQPQDLVQLLLGGLWSRRRGGPDVRQGEGEGVGIVDGEGAADGHAAAVGVGCVAEEGYVAVEDEGVERGDCAHGVGLYVGGCVCHAPDDRVPVLCSASVRSAVAELLAFTYPVEASEELQAGLLVPPRAAEGVLWVVWIGVVERYDGILALA